MKDLRETSIKVSCHCIENVKPGIYKQANSRSYLTAKITGYKQVSENSVIAKVLPITGHWGPEAEQRYSSTLSWPRRLDGGRWSAPRPGSFTPGKDPVPIVQEAGWGPGPVWTGAENLVPTGIEVQLPLCNPRRRVGGVEAERHSFSVSAIDWSGPA